MQQRHPRRGLKPRLQGRAEATVGSACEGRRPLMRLPSSAPHAQPSALGTIPQRLAGRSKCVRAQPSPPSAPALIFLSGPPEQMGDKRCSQIPLECWPHMAVPNTGLGCKRKRIQLSLSLRGKTEAAGLQETGWSLFSPASDTRRSRSGAGRTEVGYAGRPVQHL